MSFKKLLFTAVLAVVVSIASSAQVRIISSSVLFNQQVFKMDAHVVDSLTNENLSFVSAYLRHKSDTLITNFALSDADGKVELTEVTTGNYILTVEYLGYMKYEKEFYVRKDTDAGTIKLVPDVKALEASRVTAAGKEVEIKQDTIIFNASFFKTGSNDNLAALLKRMPGVEISKEGTVKVNGKQVDKITIEGKTFFMNDRTAALNNLPASIVDKIKVIDGDSDAAKLTGIKDIEKERVMDVELKEEYKTGFFGNAKIAAGTAISSSRNDEFLVTDKVPFNGSILASLYDDKDQLTITGSSSNVSDDSSNSVVIVSYGAGSMLSPASSLPMDGIHTSWNLGANLNTDRIKKVTSTLSATMNEDRVDYHNYSDRTSFQAGMANLQDKNDDFITGKTQRTTVSGDFKNLDGKRLSFTFTPSIVFSRGNRNSVSDGVSILGDDLYSTSTKNSVAEDQSFSASGNINASLKGKNNAKRRLTFGLGYGVSDGKGTAIDSRMVDFKSGQSQSQDIFYDNKNSTNSLNLNLGFVEPLTNDMTLQVMATSAVDNSENDKAATDANGNVDKTFSSYTKTRYVNNMVRIMAQYSKTMNTISVGASADITENVLESTSLGVKTVTGENDWIINLSPYLTVMRYSKDMRDYMMVNLMGGTSSPGASSTNPALKIASPTRLSVGNLYLRPYQYQNILLMYNGHVKTTNFGFSIIGNAYENNVTNATWYDSNTIMYSVPVNLKKPSANVSSTIDMSGPVTKKGTLRYTLMFDTNNSTSTSYQATGILPGIDMESFSYKDFMKAFWGNESGDAFYSGKSGFKQSKTTQASYGVNASLTLNLDSFVMSANAGFRNRGIRYSLDPSSNLSTYNGDYSIYMKYFAKHDFEFSTDASYYTFRGYRGSFNDPYCQWNASVLKNVKALTFGISVRDILNQARTKESSWSDNYSEYSFTNTIGRCVLFSVKFNFGKMNAAKSSAAQMASLRMVL